MSSKLIIPFNYQPFSVSVKTGAYTIPAGYYAYVTASVQGADTFSIGGVVALQGITAIATSGTGGVITEVNSSATNTTATFTYAVPAGYKFFWLSFCASNFSVSTDAYIDSLTFNTGTPLAVITSGLGCHYFVGSSLSTGVSNSVNGAGHGSCPILAPGQLAGVDCNYTLSITKRIVGWIERPNSINSGQGAGSSSGSFWVSQNTALTTSGGSYTVTLYPNIS